MDVMCGISGKYPMPADWVFILGCRDMHIWEIYFCNIHAPVFARHNHHCHCGAGVLHYQIGNLKTGKEPTDAQFYPGEWVAVLRNGRDHDEVVAHSANWEDMHQYIGAPHIHAVYKMKPSGEAA
jgi:hypothetical protein